MSPQARITLRHEQPGSFCCSELDQAEEMETPKPPQTQHRNEQIRMQIGLEGWKKIIPIISFKNASPPKHHAAILDVPSWTRGAARSVFRKCPRVTNYRRRKNNQRFRTEHLLMASIDKFGKQKRITMKEKAEQMVASPIPRYFTPMKRREDTFSATLTRTGCEHANATRRTRKTAKLVPCLDWPSASGWWTQ